MSKKIAPETGVRMLNSDCTLQLDITCIALTGGEPLPLYGCFGIDLFLSKDAADVQRIIDNGKCAVAYLCTSQSFLSSENSRENSFDADAVLFSEEPEQQNKRGIRCFPRVRSRACQWLVGWRTFAKLLIKLSKIQEQLPTGIEYSPFDWP